MGTWNRLLQVTTLAVLVSACGTSSSTSVNAPSARCAVTATAQPAAVGAPGGSRGRCIVRTDRECAWEARSEFRDWLAISDSSGRGDGSMRYTAAGNPVVSERRGAVVVNGLRVEIGQAAAACAFGLDRAQQSVPVTGGRIDVSVSAQAGCASDGPHRRSLDLHHLRRGRPGLRVRVALGVGKPRRAGAIQRRHHCRAALPHRASGSGHRRSRPSPGLPAPSRAAC